MTPKEAMALVPGLQLMAAEACLELLVDRCVGAYGASLRGYVPSDPMRVADLRSAFMEAAERYRLAAGDDGVEYARAYGWVKFGEQLTEQALAFTKGLPRIEVQL